MNDLLTLTDASERLGVHYMTAYRYVRTGRLAAIKDGGQWRVGVAALANFQADGPLAPRSEVIPSMVLGRLIVGDENGAFQLLEGAMASGADAIEVYVDLLAPALATIGEQWSAGDLSIADEHIASATALRVIGRLGPRVAQRGRTRGTILLATVAEDHHFVPTALLRDLLRHRGFAVIDLGGNTPAASIAEHADSLGDDLIAIGLCATYPGAADVVGEALTTIRKTVGDLPIVVGGSAFRDEAHIASLGDCRPSTSARNALDVFAAIHDEAKSR